VVNEISVVSQEEEKEDFDHSDNDRNSDHQGWENDSSDDQVSVDRDSDDDIDDQDLDDQDFDEREPINEDSDNNGQASASVGVDQELESSSESGSDGSNDPGHFWERERDGLDEDSRDPSGGDIEGSTSDQTFHSSHTLSPSIGSGDNISESFEQSSGVTDSQFDTDLAAEVDALEDNELGN